MGMFIYVPVPLQYASARCEDVKSFVDDLSLGQGVVLSRVASTLRSIETQPFDRGFVRIRRIISFRSLNKKYFELFDCQNVQSQRLCQVNYRNFHFFS